MLALAFRHFMRWRTRYMVTACPFRRPEKIRLHGPCMRAIIAPGLQMPRLNWTGLDWTVLGCGQDRIAAERAHRGEPAKKR